MTRDRRQQRRRARPRRRRAAPVGYEPVRHVQLPGVMGWFQRNPRIFYVTGIAVMVLSLGAVFFATQTPSTPPADPTTTPTPVAESETTATPEASPTATPSPTEEPIQRTYSAPPALESDPAARYEAVIRTEKGDVRLELLPDAAPSFVNNFVFLARNDFYDGLTFHRVIPDFVAQAGDPTGTGSGGPGYSLPPETNDLPFDEGVISMAKGGDTVSGSQFFITLAPTPGLADDFTVFGRVVEGMEVLRALTERDPRQPGLPPGDRIIDVEIVEQP